MHTDKHRCRRVACFCRRTCRRSMTVSHCCVYIALLLLLVAVQTLFLLNDVTFTTDNESANAETAAQLTAAVPDASILDAENVNNSNHTQMRSRVETESTPGGAPLLVFTERLQLCNPAKRLIFVKTHKTGSTTMQNIIFRFGVSHNVMFALPPAGNEFTVYRPFLATDVPVDPLAHSVDLFRLKDKHKSTKVNHGNSSKANNATSAKSGFGDGEADRDRGREPESTSPHANPSTAAAAAAGSGGGRVGMFEMFAFHAIFNYAEMRTTVPGAPFVSILRDPVDCFESIYVFMELRRMYKMDINEFAYSLASSGVKRDKRRPDFGKNQYLYVFGLDADAMEDRQRVADKIAELEQQLTLVMITERFDESLILFKDLMCWSTTDLIYLKKNFRSSEQTSSISPEARQILHKWLWADVMLYDHFATKLDRLLKQRSGLAAEVASLQTANAQLERHCVEKTAASAHLPSAYRDKSPVVVGYVVNESLPLCAATAVTETHFVGQLRLAQRSRLAKMRQHVAPVSIEP